MSWSYPKKLPNRHLGNLDPRYMRTEPIMAITTDEGIGILEPQQAILLIREILSRSDLFRLESRKSETDTLSEILLKIDPSSGSYNEEIIVGVIDAGNRTSFLEILEEIPLEICTHLATIPAAPMFTDPIPQFSHDPTKTPKIGNLVGDWYIVAFRKQP